MKRHVSVWMLFARSTIWRVLGVLALMAAAEAGMFGITLSRMGGAPGLEEALRSSRIDLAGIVGFLALCAVLCAVGCDFGARQGYTLRRLRVSQWSVVFWQAVQNTLCFLLFWAVQLGIALGLCALYPVLTGAALWQQETLLAFYRLPCLHGLLPLAEWVRYLCNAVLCLGLGVTAACFSVQQRYGQRGMGIAVLAAATMVFFRQSMGGSNGSNGPILALLALISASITLQNVRGVISDEAKA